MLKKSALIILDGIGISKNKKGNAFLNATTPNLDNLIKNYPFLKINASEEFVGLPKKQMGNSEVGHLNIGAGRIVYTGLSLINKEIKDKLFFKNKAFLNAIDHCKKNNSKLHILGLCSDGGVHSSLQHVFALMNIAKQNNIPTVLHCFTDGRDVSPKSFINDLKQIELKAKKTNVKIGSVGGRFYAMDRDKRWERVEKEYLTLIGKEKNSFKNLSQYISQSYKNNITDEFIVPAYNANYKPSEIFIVNNDAVIFSNFRPDRARELSHLIYGSQYYDFIPKFKLSNIYFVTMMNYEGITPSIVAYPPQDIKNTLGEIISRNNLKQARIAETEKYAHVTFFMDGGKEIDFKNEKKILIPSPKVKTYDLAPEMSALEITENIIKEFDKQDVIIANYANGDMVGHTGNYQTAIKAVEVVDQQIGKLLKAANDKKWTLFIIADHGNCEEMIDANGNPITKHTLNLVPFIVTDKKVKLNKNIVGSLSNVAPTILNYMGINIPKEMTSKSLIKK